MNNLLKNHRFWAGLLSVFVSVFLVAVFVYAATTIGSNISTGGTLSVTGASTLTGNVSMGGTLSVSGATSLSTASTTGDFWLGNQTADDDDYLYMDASSTEYLMWDDSPGQFVLSDDLLLGTTDKLFFRDTGLYIYSNADGKLTISADGTGTDDITLSGTVIMSDNATTTGYLTVGTTAANDDDYIYFDSGWAEYLKWADSSDRFEISDDLHIGGSATSTGYVVVGAPTADNIDFGAGDLIVADDIEIDDDLFVNDDTTLTGTLSVGGGSTITKFIFGTCNIAATTITASSTAYVDCTGATGVAAGDKVFVTATSSLPTNFVIQAASSTAADTINLRILNLGFDGTTDTGGRSFYWQAIR
jgi:hypothetical protein